MHNVKMGGGPDSGTVLIVSFRDEPTSIVESIRAEFPNYEVVFYRTSFVPAKSWQYAGESVPAELWKKADVLVTLAHLPPSQADAPKYVKILA